MVDYNRFRQIETDLGPRWIDLARPWLMPLRHPAAFLTAREMMSDEERKAWEIDRIVVAGLFRGWQEMRHDPKFREWLGGDPGETSPSSIFIEKMVPTIAGTLGIQNYANPYRRALGLLASRLSPTPMLTIQEIMAEIDRLGGIMNIVR